MGIGIGYWVLAARGGDEGERRDALGLGRGRMGREIDGPARVGRPSRALFLEHY